MEHYRGHRRSGTAISVATGVWHDRNRHLIPDEWLDNKAELLRRLSEYGRFEESRRDYNKRNPGSPSPRMNSWKKQTQIPRTRPRPRTGRHR
ncbi:MAG: hypothetical protein IPN33_25770 [Saprospiraceae bacterium]|nr:hypothetical protein [Saprospiraceae bacterium]